MNNHTKCELNLCSGLREDVEKVLKVHYNNDNDDGHRMIARVTLTHWAWLKTIRFRYLKIYIDKFVMLVKNTVVSLCLQSHGL